MSPYTTPSAVIESTARRRPDGLASTDALSGGMGRMAVTPMAGVGAASSEVGGFAGSAGMGDENGSRTARDPFGKLVPDCPRCYFAVTSDSRSAVARLRISTTLLTYAGSAVRCMVTCMYDLPSAPIASWAGRICSPKIEAPT